MHLSQLSVNVATTSTAAAAAALLSAPLLTAADGTKSTHLKSPLHDCSRVNETVGKAGTGCSRAGGSYCCGRQ